MAKFEIPEKQVREMQQKGLEMLCYFDKFCTEHDLTYFLCGGCCIGTIRNEGFIPWDDDVDVFMPRKDYEQLKKLWKDTPRYSIPVSYTHLFAELLYSAKCCILTLYLVKHWYLILCCQYRRLSMLFGGFY